MHGCDICADRAAVGRVEARYPDGSADVTIGGGRERIALDLVEADRVHPGTRLLVHQGFAIAVLEEGAGPETPAGLAADEADEERAGLPARGEAP
ncbi:MAG TPA: HypC/HybG/HupF family hydrogenase formation chaperone [Vicinamibacterales bacterium]|nr:HypC/HybG/HupF family hydrogenase formation chaperone [Vicinamibacterales bacterium]